MKLTQLTRRARRLSARLNYPCEVHQVAGGYVVQVAGVRSDTWRTLKDAEHHAIHRFFRAK